MLGLDRRDAREGNGYHPLYQTLLGMYDGREPVDLVTVQQRLRDLGKLDANLRISKSPLHVDDTPALGIGELRARVRAIDCRGPLRLVIVDYLQLVHGTGRRTDSRAVEVGEISGGLKALARELKVPTVAACQLNRDSDTVGRKPRLSDLRESGSIEQDADIVFLLYRPTTDEYEAEAEVARGVYPVRLLVAKNRSGEAGRDIDLTFFAKFQRFEVSSPA